jgi:hypothetical protein
MARLSHTTQKSVIPFLPSRLAERPLRRLVTGQSSHLERLHHRLHEEQEHLRQELEQHGSSSLPQQEVESARRCSPVPPLEAPPAPPLSVLAAGVAIGGDLDNRDDDDSTPSHNIDLSEEQELEGWVARPITRDTVHGCHFHDALDTLLCQALDWHTWSIEYHCVVFQHSREAYLDRLEATCLVRHPDDSLQGTEVCSENYSISERDSTEVAMQDAARHALSHYCSVLGGVADGLNPRYYAHRSSGSTGGVVVSPVGEDNPRLSSTFNLAVVLNTELDHTLEELYRARAKIVQLWAERAKRRHLADGSPTPVGTQHPYRSSRRGRHVYGNPDCRIKINLGP